MSNYGNAATRPGITYLTHQANQIAAALSRYVIPVLTSLALILILFSWSNSNDFGPGSLLIVYMAEGGVLALAFFLSLFAAINHRWVYILFALWLIGTLRITAMVLGWDIVWLGHHIPLSSLDFIRAITCAVYYIVCWQLFVTLFAADLADIQYKRLQGLGLWFGLLLLLAAFIVPHKQFVPIATILGFGGILIAIVLSIKITQISGNRLALWYGLALLVVLVFGAVTPYLSGTLVGGVVSGGAYGHVVIAALSSALVAFVIAQQERIERYKRLQAQADLQRVYELTPTGLFTLDADGYFMRSNAAFKSILGLRRTLDHQTSWSDYFGDPAWHRIAKLADNQLGGEIEVRALAAGSVVHRTFLVRAIRIGNRIKGSLQDISERVETETRLRILANQDPITKALNQRGLEQSLGLALQGLVTGEPLAVAHLDLHSLHSIRELHGHETSDDVLKEWCERIRQVLKGSQSLSRLKDTELVIVFSDTEIAQAREQAQQIINAITATTPSGARFSQIKIYLGLIEIVDETTDTQAAILAATRASRQARRNNSPLLVYEHMQSLLTEHSQELKLMRDFSKGFSPEGLYLVMQPILSLDNPTTSFDIEVLLRMQDENGLPVATPKLIAIAEDCGAIPDIDKWVLATALDWLDTHHQQTPLLHNMAININGVSLNNPDFIETLFATLHRYQHLSHYLSIEITEGVALHQIEEARQLILQLQTLGVRIVLDDFGAGYTSFSYLKKLPADALKIDGALIRNMLDHERDTALISTIITLARNLDMKVVAEWVEDEATLRKLVDMGVDYVQGYVITAAVLPEEIVHCTQVTDLVKTPAIRPYLHALAAKTF